MTKERKPEKKVTTIRLGLDLLEELKAKADYQGRSLNNLIERILSEQVEKKVGN